MIVAQRVQRLFGVVWSPFLDRLFGFVSNPSSFPSLLLAFHMTEHSRSFLTESGHLSTVHLILTLLVTVKRRRMHSQQPS